MKEINYYPCNARNYDDLKRYSSTNFNQITNNRTMFLSVLEEKNSKDAMNKDPISNSFEYYINDYGFRGKWDFKPTTKKIGFFGCSFTFGMGVDEPYIFSSVVESRYGKDKVESINFGQHGSSIQRTAKLFSAANKIFNFDAVVITVPSMERFLVTRNEDQSLVDIVPGFIPDDLKTKAGAIYKLLSPKDLELLAIDYIHWIKSECASIDHVIWGSWSGETYKLLKNIIERENLLPIWPHHVMGKARDNVHPGKLQHAQYAKHIFDFLNNRYFLNN